MADIKTRKVEMFRAHIDPAIGAKAKNAFKLGADGIKEMEMSPIGVYVKWVNTSPGNTGQESEHVVPFANIQSIKFAPAEK